MYVYPFDLSSLKIKEKGVWEEGTTHVFKDIVKKGNVVVDIGANIGYYTLIAADLVGNNGKVYAFEPDPLNFLLLKRNIELNGYSNVTAIQEALSDFKGICTLFMGSVFRRACSSTSVKRSLLYRSIKVRCTTLDEFLNKEGKDVDVIKMDIEGGEYKAFRGMLRTVKKSKDLKIIVEFEPSFKHSHLLLTELTKNGFKLHVIKEDGNLELMSPDKIIELCRIRNKFYNLLCVKNND